ncbi:MAG: hypothetical protein AAGJ29_09110 [Pseudomonadota bacterium]
MGGWLSKLAVFGRDKRDKAVEDAEALTIAERSGGRAPAFKDAVVTTDSGARVRAIALDFDPLGARVRFMSHPSFDGIVRLSINGVCKQRAARVAWRDNNDVGLQFLDDAA